MRCGLHRAPSLHSPSPGALEEHQDARSIWTPTLRLGKTAEEGAPGDAASANLVEPLLQAAPPQPADCQRGTVDHKQFAAGLLLSRAPLLSLAEVAARLSVSRATAYKLCNSGELPHVRIRNAIRVSDAQLAAYLSNYVRAV